MLINIFIDIVNLLLINNSIVTQFCKYIFIYAIFNQNLIRSFVSLIITFIKFSIIYISCLAILF